MNCESTKENIVLYVYDELADDAKFEFENHVRQCQGCRQELDSALEFKNDMAVLPLQDVSASFLAANRMQLQESLEHAAQSRSFLNSFVFDFAALMQQIKLAPALTTALLIVGFAGGVGTTYRMMQNKIPDGGAIKDQPYSDAASVAYVDSIKTDANSNQVLIKYNTLQPQTRQGAVTDPYIHQLLLLAARNNRN